MKKEKLKKKILALESANLQLNKDVHTLITDPKSIQGLIIKGIHQMKMDINETIWFGDGTGVAVSMGLWARISNEHIK